MDCGEPVYQVRLKPGMSVGDLVEELGRAGAYNAGALYRAVNIYEHMLRDQKATRFFGLAGAMVPAGMGGIITDLIEKGYIDVLVSTGANCVHDIIEALGCHRYHGTSSCSDIELRRLSINRIYDVFLPDESFTRFEEFIQGTLHDLSSDSVFTIAGLLSALGKKLPSGILATAEKKNIPVFSPAFQDSMLGLQYWLFTQTHHAVLDAAGDMKDLLDRCFNADHAGAFFVGGGVPKNFILQSMLLTPKGFDYAIQLTGDRPDLGGLSGATLDEARSWGKLAEDAVSVTVYGDATITLPLLVAATLERLSHD
ncbi:MAG: deoxyhypusine synthase [Methanomicrobiales archaeon]|nr:deoxyhypusine synthase [Methanomicrobiales archaeon]